MEKYLWCSQLCLCKWEMSKAGNVGPESDIKIKLVNCCSGFFLRLPNLPLVIDSVSHSLLLLNSKTEVECFGIYLWESIMVRGGSESTDILDLIAFWQLLPWPLMCPPVTLSILILSRHGSKNTLQSCHQSVFTNLNDVDVDIDTDWFLVLISYRITEAKIHCNLSAVFISLLKLTHSDLAIPYLTQLLTK